MAILCNIPIENYCLLPKNRKYEFLQQDLLIILIFFFYKGQRKRARASERERERERENFYMIIIDIFAGVRM